MPNMEMCESRTRNKRIMMTRRSACPLCGNISLLAKHKLKVKIRFMRLQFASSLTLASSARSPCPGNSTQLLQDCTLRPPVLRINPLARARPSPSLIIHNLLITHLASGLLSPLRRHLLIKDGRHGRDYSFPAFLIPSRRRRAPDRDRLSAPSGPTQLLPLPASLSALIQAFWPPAPHHP